MAETQGRTVLSTRQELDCVRTCKSVPVSGMQDLLPKSSSVRSSGHPQQRPNVVHRSVRMLVHSSSRISYLPPRWSSPMRSSASSITTEFPRMTHIPMRTFSPFGRASVASSSTMFRKTLDSCQHGRREDTRKTA
jgi:hypothetical protein